MSRVSDFGQSRPAEYVRGPGTNVDGWVSKRGKSQLLHGYAIGRSARSEVPSIMESNERKRSLTVVVTLFLLFVAHEPLGAGALLHAPSTEQTWEQAAGGKQQSEVASVRENKSDGRSYSNFSLDNGNAYFTVSENGQPSPSGSLFSANNQTLMRYIIFACKLSGTQELALRFDFFEGPKLLVPQWVRGDRFDIEVRAPKATARNRAARFARL